MIAPTADLRQYLGKKATLPVQKNRESGYDLTMRVLVRDARVVYGRVELLVEPLAGSGTAWVKLDRLTL